LVDYLIFPAGPSDAEALAKVHVASWRETYEGLLPDAYLARMSVEDHARRWFWSLSRPDPQEITLTACGRDGLVGYVSGGRSRRRRPDEAEVTTLYVLRKAQDAGLGRELLKAAARVLAAQGMQSLAISVLRDNVKARGFYERLGGIAEASRPERGPGGVLHEVYYVWPDIRTLTSG
jgi:ribosomal protein S18 acetylase RimI-like enzyme